MKIFCCRVSLAQLVKFLVVKLTHSNLNHRFDMSVTFTANYFFGGDVSVDNESVLVTHFMNLKIKSAQSFRCGRVYVHVFIRMSDHTCIIIYVCIMFLIFLKNIRLKGLFYGNVKSPL
jgi:hypothetical protein